MNRLITSSLDAPGADLPPATRTGPARVLFIHSNQLGFVNQSRQLKAYTAARDDVDAVHLDLIRPAWAKILGKSLPLPCGWDFAGYRNLVLTRTRTTRVLRPVLKHFDVIHITTQGVAGSILDLKGAGSTKWSLYLDSTAPLEVRTFGTSRTAAGPMIRAERAMFAAADLVVPMSNWAATSLREDYGVGPEKVCIAPGCLPLPPISVKPPDPGRLPRIVFIGNDWARKGGPELLAVHQGKFFERAHLDIVSAEARGGAMRRNVTFHGRLEHDEIVNRILPSADLFVLPTKFDMSPWVLLEAAAAGLPVISSPLGAIPEMVLHDRTGVLVPPGDASALSAAIDRLLSDPDLRRQMGSAAAAHVRQHYDPDRVYNGLLDRLVSLAG